MIHAVPLHVAFPVAVPPAHCCRPEPLANALPEPVLRPVYQLQQALDALAYWSAPRPYRRPAPAPLLPLEQMYAYWRPE